MVYGNQPCSTRKGRAFGLVEILIGSSIFLLVFGIALAMVRFGDVSVNRTLSAHLGLQMETRKALLEFIREIQEAIEIVRPQQGSSLTYFLARDKLNRILTGYLCEDPQSLKRTGKLLYQLYLVRSDYSGNPAIKKKPLLTNVERLTFTTLSPGVLQIRADIYEQKSSYTILTAVRTRNVFADSDL